MISYLQLVVETFAPLGQCATILDGVLDVLINVQVPRHVSVLAVRLLLILVLVLGQMVVRRRSSGGQQGSGNFVLKG